MKQILFILLLIGPSGAEVSKQAQSILKKALEFNALGDYPSALSKYIEAYNTDAGILGLKDEGLLENSTKYYLQYLKNNRGDINSLMWIASLETLKGDYRAAIEYYQKVIHNAPKSPESIEADKEIIRLEQLIREAQELKAKIQTKENEEIKNLERIQKNVKREMEQKYQEQIGKLNQQIEQMQKEQESLRSKALKAETEATKIKAELEELKALNRRHRRLYLIYKKKAGVE